MGGLGAALRSDMFLALRGHGLKLVIVAPALAALVKIALVRSGEVRGRATTLLTGTGSAPPLSENAYGPFVDGLVTGWTLLALTVVVLAAATARSFDNGAVRLPLTRGVSRGAWVLSRVLVLTFQTFLGIAALALASWFGAALLYDFGPIVEEGLEIFSSQEVQWEIFVGIATASLPLLPTLTFGVLVACCSRSASVAGSVALVSCLVFDVFKNALGEAHRYVYASYLPTLLDKSCLGETAKFVRGFSDAGYSEEDLFLNFLVPIPEALLFLAIAMVVAARRKM